MLRDIVKNSRGQSMVELGLIAPLLLIALYIPVDFGVALFKAHMAQKAAREAARHGTTAWTLHLGTLRGKFPRIPARQGTRHAETVIAVPVRRRVVLAVMCRA